MPRGSQEFYLLTFFNPLKVEGEGDFSGGKNHVDFKGTAGLYMGIQLIENCDTVEYAERISA